MNDTVRKHLTNTWQQYLLYGVACASVASVMWFRLFKLVPFAGPSEVLAREAARTVDLLIQNPLFLPHKAIQLFLFVIGLDSLLATRAISTFFALIAVVFFYRVVRTWYTSRVAMLATALFVSSSWFLHVARLGTPTVLYALSIVLLWAGLRMRSNKPRNLTLSVVGISILSLLFVPGFVWIILAGIIWQRKRVIQEIKHVHNGVVIALMVLTVPVVGLLGYAFYKDTSLIAQWLGLPEILIIKDAVINFILTPYHIFVRAPFQPEFWLGRLPYVDIAMTILFGLGVYVLYKTSVLDRMRALVGMGVIGALLASLNGAVNLIIVMPFIFVLITAGIALLLQQWFTVFPRNPIARNIGFIAISLLVCMSVYFNLYSYFVAWPKNVDTKKTFTTQIP